MSDTAVVLVCSECDQVIGQAPEDNAARSILLLAHWKRSRTCEAAGYSERETKLSDRTRGRLTYAAVEEIVREAYELGQEHAKNDYRSTHGQPAHRTAEGWGALASELWRLIKGERKRRRQAGDEEE